MESSSFDMITNFISLNKHKYFKRTVINGANISSSKGRTNNKKYYINNTGKMYCGLYIKDIENINESTIIFMLLK